YIWQAKFIKNNVKSPGFHLSLSNGAYIESSAINAENQDCTFQGDNTSYLKTSSFLANDIDLAGGLQIFGTCYLYANIISSATLKNYSNNEYTCYVSGSFVNNGAVTNNNYGFNIYISGDVTNNGTWTNNKTYLNGAQDQTLNFIKPFGGSYLINSEAAGKIILASNMFLNNTRMEMANDTIVTDVCDTVSLNNGYIWQVVFIKNSTKANGLVFQLSNGAYSQDLTMKTENQTCYFEMGNTTYLRNSSFIADLIHFYGIVSIYYNCYFTSDIISFATVQNYNNNNYNCYVSGFYKNMGRVINSGYQLYMHIAGDIVNDSTWTNQITYLTGDVDQTITMSQPFGSAQLINSNTGGMLIAGSDLEFNNTQISLSNDTILLTNCKSLKLTGGYMQNGVLIKEPGKIKTMSFYLDNNAYLLYCPVKTPGFTDYFFLDNGARLDKSNIQAGWIVLSGTVQIIGNPMIMEGEVLLSGNLKTYPNNHYSLQVNGNFVNNGNITNNNYQFYLYITGDVLNNGNWSNQWTQLNGSEDQHVGLVNGAPINGQMRFLSDVGTSFNWQFEGSTLVGNPDFSGANSSLLQFQVPVSVTYTGTFYCQTNQGPSRNIIVADADPILFISLKALLEGPFNGTLMNTTLNSGGEIPLSQPYNTAPWNYAGTETVAALPGPDAVDWVLIELRDATDATSATSATIVARQAAFITSNGDIISFDGNNYLEFVHSINNSLFVVLWHRNHVGIMSSYSLVPLTGVYSYDFTSDAGQVYGGSQGHKEIAAGVWGMIGGDGNADGQVNNSDKNDVWIIQAGLNGYRSGDFNLDTQVNNSDKNDIWVPNTGLGSQVP
ncbi:MAG: hypothetical protein JXA03_03120, partial [Bacteroidales bacterium]|nr:hypothetical protein [Bacteroidales bacterium]